MAGARVCATFASLPIPRAAASPNLPSSSVSLPYKPTRRRNHLRPKILKTLNPKPQLPILHSPPTQLEPTSDQTDVVSPEPNEITASETTAPELPKFSVRDVLKYGGYFLGLFLLQTAISVVIMGGSDHDEDKKSKTNGESVNAVRIDESKIEEIREMARRARRMEKNEGVGEDGGVSSVSEEVGNQLVSLQRRLGKKRLPGSAVSFVEVASERGGEEEDASLMFKKKMRFRTPTTLADRDPKGFGVGGNGRDASVVGGDGVELFEGDGDKSVRDDLEEESGRLEVGDLEVREPQNGTVRKTIQERSSSEDVRAIKPRGFGKKSPASSKKKNQGTVIKSDGPAALSVNSGSKKKEREKQELVRKARSRQSENETDPWWLHLPYVLVIAMHRGSDGQGGVFSVELNSQSQEGSDTSYAVAFEDRSDAQNFCFLLESCFEDQDDFEATAAPLPIEELLQAMQSDDMKVIVVKKRQLKLYAGQPFAEVEMALRSLAVQN